MENKKVVCKKSSCETAELFDHSRRETSKRLVDKLLMFLQNSSITAKDYSTHLQTIEMCEHMVLKHAQEKLVALDFKKKSVWYTFPNREGSEHIFYLKDI